MRYDTIVIGAGAAGAVLAARLSEDSQRSVLEGLRVVGAAVMPDVIRANTNATTIMMAERVADWRR